MTPPVPAPDIGSVSDIGTVSDRGLSYALHPLLLYIALGALLYGVYILISYRNQQTITTPCSLTEDTALTAPGPPGSGTPLQDVAEPTFREITGTRPPDHPHFGDRLGVKDYLH